MTKLTCVREQEDVHHPTGFPVKSGTRSELTPDRVPRGNQPARRFLPPSPALGFPFESPHCQKQCTAEDKFVWFPPHSCLTRFFNTRFTGGNRPAGSWCFAAGGESWCLCEMLRKIWGIRGLCAFFKNSSNSMGEGSTTPVKVTAF